jgi:aldehyde:ferredoxin oxidoreductase
MEYFGYAGCILHVDLTTREIRKESLDMEMARKYLGGGGFSNRLVADVADPMVDPLSPGNVMVYAPGALVGTMAPGASKLRLTYKQPATKTWGSGSGSGAFGFMIKAAGYDAVVITGKASQPVYLMIEDEPKICEANKIWGLDLSETTRALWKKHNFCSVHAIGTAGENLVKTAFGMIDKRSTLGRGGLGAVMGSKNLKAVVARAGSKGIKIFDPKRFMKIVNEVYKPMVEDPLREAWREHGVLIGWPTWAKGGFSYRNWSKFFPENKALELYDPGEFYKTIVKTRLACSTCPVGDKGRFDIIDGEFSGREILVSELLQEITDTAMKMDVGADYNKRLIILDMADRYGLDIMEFTGLLDWVIDLQERGILTREDTDGVELKRDFNTVMTWMEKISKREGFGDVLADGWLGAIQRVGRGCEKYAVHCKGLTPAFMDARIVFNPEAFEECISPRGATVVTAESPAILPMRPLDKIWRHCDRMRIPEEAKEKIFDIPDEFSVPLLTRRVEDWFQFYTCLGFCARQQIQQRHNFMSMYNLYLAATGMDIAEEEMLTVGERVVNLEKAFNALCGLSRKDDKFPEMWFEPLETIEEPKIRKPLTDYYRKVELTREDVEKIFDEYYADRGWNVEKGIPTKEKLMELGLEDIAERLWKSKGAH